MNTNSSSELQVSKSAPFEKQRVALVGAGYISDSHAKAIRQCKHSEIVAVLDTSSALAHAAAARFGGVLVCESLAQAVSAGATSVHVLTPANRHYEIAKDALSRGLHVFCEKPFVTDVEQARELVLLASKNNVKLAVNHNFLFCSAYDRMRKDVRSGFFGPLHHLTVTWALPLGQLVNGPFGGWLTEHPGNIFHEIGPHVIGFAIDLLGAFTLDRIEPFDPLDLPNGRRIYRRWFVKGHSGDTVVEFHLSARMGAVERVLRVRGIAASGECHFDRDIYRTSELGSLNPMLDDLSDGIQHIRSSTRQVMGNFRRSLVGSLRRTSDVNAYASTFLNSISAFYFECNTPLGNKDQRLSAKFATDVVKVCVDVAQDDACKPVSTQPAIRELISFPPSSGVKVLVTGATGFIGKVLVKKLLAQGHDVRIISRSFATAESAFSNLVLTVHVGSLSDREFLSNVLSGVDVVYHLAKGDGKRWADYLATDVEPSLLFAECCAQQKVKRFIYTGTIDSYYSGDPKQVITGQTLLDPNITNRNHYARAKATVEKHLLEMRKATGFPVVVVRPGIVIGRGFSPAHWGVGMFLNATNMSFWGDGQHLLPFVLVDDVAQALLLSLDAAALEGRALLVTSPALLSGQDYVKALSDAMGTRIRVQPQSALKSYCGDVFKELIKHVIRHPNRRIPSYRDWRSRQHIARYDATETYQLLGWEACPDKQVLIAEGIEAPAQDLLR